MNTFKHFFLIIILSFSHSLIAALTVDNLLNTGAQSYLKAEKDIDRARQLEAFRSAIEDWEKAVAIEPSDALYYNLGNAYYKSGKIGLALLNYYRCLWLHPQHPEALGNVRFISANDPTLIAENQPHFERWRSHTATFWTLFAAISFWTSVIALYCSFKLTRAAVLLRIGGSMALILSCIGIYGACQWHVLLDTGIVITPDAPLHLSPTRESESISKIMEGSCLKFSQKHGDFYLVESSEGHNGWIAADSFQPVIQ
jgi:hypothetical protein